MSASSSGRFHFPVADPIGSSTPQNQFDRTDEPVFNSDVHDYSRNRFDVNDFESVVRENDFENDFDAVEGDASFMLPEAAGELPRQGTTSPPMEGEPQQYNVFPPSHKPVFEEEGTPNDFTFQRVTTDQDSTRFEHTPRISPRHEYSLQYPHTKEIDDNGPPTPDLNPSGEALVTPFPQESVSNFPPPPPVEIPLPSFRPSGGSLVMVDMTAVASVLHHDVTQRRLMKNWMRSVLYFAVIAVAAGLHTDVTEASYLTTTLSNNFLRPFLSNETDRTIEDIATVSDVYLWLENVWAPGLFKDFSISEINSTTQLMMTPYNKVIETPYIRTQKKARSSSCNGEYLIMPPSREESDIGFYCHSGLERNSWSVNGRTYTPVEGLDILQDEQGDSLYAVFRINSQSYGSLNPLYTTFNITNLQDAQAALQILKEDEFFTEENTMLEVIVVVYNPYVDLVGSAKLVFDVGSSGSVTPFAHGSVLQITRLDWYITGKDKARFVLEIVFMVATFTEAILTYARIRRARRRGASVLAYFTSKSWAWNWFEVFYVVVALVVFSLYARLLVEQPTLVDVVYLIDSRFDTLSPVYSASKTMNAILIALTGLKILRYMGFIPGWAPLFLAFERFIKPLITLVLLTVLFAISFTVAGMYAFGGNLAKMRDFGIALHTVLSFFTRDMSYTSLTGPVADSTNGVFPPMYYWVVFLSMSVLVVGIIVAIAVVSHGLAQDEAFNRHKIGQSARRWRLLAPRPEWWTKIPGSRVFDFFPRTLLEIFAETGKRWMVPLMVDYKATSHLVAETGGGTLRVYFSVQDWFKRKLVGARGIAVVVPGGAFAPNLARHHKGSLARVRPGQAMRLTTEPLQGSEEIDFIVDGGLLRTKGGIDLSTPEGFQIVLEFPGVMNDAYPWPNNEVMVSMDTVKRITTYGGCFTHAPADWIVCSLGNSASLSICPFLVLESEVPLEELLQAVENGGMDVSEHYWRHSVTCLAQMFSRTIDVSLTNYRNSPRINPLEAESTWVRESSLGRRL